MNSKISILQILLSFLVSYSFSFKGIKLYEEYMKLRGKDDAFKIIFGLRSLRDLTDPILRQNQYGFQPGLWGSQILPTNFWFLNVTMFQIKPKYANHYDTQNEVKKLNKNSFSWILSSNQSVLINMNWLNLTRLCDEIRFPRCSWKYFINIADPTGMDYNLLKDVNPFLSNSNVVKEYSHMFLKDYIVPVTLTDCYPIESIDQMSAIYIYSVCFMYSDNWNSDSMRICPDPCKNYPCRDIRNADVNSCQKLGIYKRDFSCACLRGYSWDAKGLSCLAENSCFKICDRKGTMKCNFSPNEGTIECICKSGFMGFDCSVLNNACIFADSIHNFITGLDACNVDEGKNKCVPLLGTAAYSCGCSPPFVADRNLPYDNCLATMEQCANRLCVFGSCETSPDGYRSYCQCDLDFKGEECDVPRGQWSPWSNWTQCFPDCGKSSMRQRIRYCVGQIDDCIGHPEEVEKCTVELCFYERPPEDITYDVFWSKWFILTTVTVSYLMFVVLVSSILTLFRSQQSKADKKAASKIKKMDLAKSIKRIKMKFGLTLNADNVMETLEEIWNPDADDDELKMNLKVVNEILMKIQKKNPKVFQLVSERSEIAALALSYNQ